jgi:hypothetical protein
VTVLKLRAERLRWVEADGEVVALDEHSLMYLNANPSGALLWDALAAGATREQLIDELMGAFDVDAEMASRDVDLFVADLESRGLLEG